MSCLQFVSCTEVRYSVAMSAPSQPSRVALILYDEGRQYPVDHTLIALS
jgi:hypothetical protein